MVCRLPGKRGRYQGVRFGGTHIWSESLRRRVIYNQRKEGQMGRLLGLSVSSGISQTLCRRRYGAGPQQVHHTQQRSPAVGRARSGTESGNLRTMVQPSRYLGGRGRSMDRLSEPQQLYAEPGQERCGHSFPIRRGYQSEHKVLRRAEQRSGRLQLRFCQCGDS